MEQRIALILADRYYYNEAVKILDDIAAAHGEHKALSDICRDAHEQSRIFGSGPTGPP